MAKLPTTDLQTGICLRSYGRSEFGGCDAKGTGSKIRASIEIGQNLAAQQIIGSVE
jgi:hypothetical protein